MEATYLPVKKCTGCGYRGVGSGGAAGLLGMRREEELLREDHSSS